MLALCATSQLGASAPPIEGLPFQIGTLDSSATTATHLRPFRSPDEIKRALEHVGQGGKYRDTFNRFIEKAHERGLRKLGIDRADVLILGWFNRYPGRRVLDAATRFKEQGKVRFLAMSGHNRKTHGRVAAMSETPIDILMVRYNAAHTGAERDIFPHLPADNRPGITSYTATRWGQLLKERKMPAGEEPMTAAECYRFVLSNPNIDLCFTGPKNVAELDHALLALDAGPLSAEEIERVRRIGDHVHG